MSFAEVLQRLVFEPTIIVNSAFYSIGLVIALYKKRQSKNALWISLQILCLFLLAELLTGIFYYVPKIPYPYSFYFKFFLISFLYVLPLPFFNPENKLKPSIVMAALFFSMNFVIGEIGGSIPILVQGSSQSSVIDIVIRYIFNLTLVVFGIFMRKFSLQKIKTIPTVSIVFLSIQSFFELGMSIYSGNVMFRKEKIVAGFQLISFFTVAVLNYLAYYMIYEICIKNDLSIELQAQNFELEKNKDLIEVSEENLQKLRSIKHDTKNQYALMKSLLENKEYDELNKFFESYGDGIIEPISFISSDNRILSSILNVEYSKAKANGISFDLKLAVREKLPFESTDLSSVLFNLLDNAIEACLYYHIEKPVITIRIREYQNYLFIDISNPVSKNLSLEELRKIKTTKKDKQFHGYGTKIIKAIVKKYSGTAQREVKNGCYNVKLMLKEKGKDGTTNSNS